MKRLLYPVLVMLPLLFTASCEELDMEALMNSANAISELENRVSALEEKVDKMNTDIANLSTLLGMSSSGTGDYITSVTPITANGVVTGYTITFAIHDPIVVHNGTDGATPKLAVRQDTDGKWYWTVDGQWLLDSTGKKVPATGSDGKDGKDAIAPKLKIENGRWLLSTDDGKTWTDIGQATGDDGDSFFQSVSTDAGASTVTFTLADGTTFTVPMKPAVSINFNAEDLQAPISDGETISIGYSLYGADDNTLVSASSDGNYKVVVHKINNYGGSLEVTAPQKYTDGFINVLVSDGKGFTYLKVINFYKRNAYTSNGNEYALSSHGGSFEIPFHVNFDYTVNSTVNWITYVETKAPGMRTDRLCFTATSNAEEYARTGQIRIFPTNNQGHPYITITINQASAVFSIDKTQFIASENGDSFTSNITSSSGCVVNIPADCSWLTKQLTNTGDDYTLTLTAAKNTTTERRYANVTIYSDTNKQLATVSVVQYASDEDEKDALILTFKVNYANDFHVVLPIPWNEDMLVDWGDGVVERYESNSDRASHTYQGLETGKTFDVKITGAVNYLSTYGMSDASRKAIIAVKQWGRVGVKYLSSYSTGAFQGCTNLDYVAPDNDYSLAEVLKADHVFAGCTSLTSIPEGLFSACKDANTFANAFSDCTGLTAVPKRLFAGCTSANSFYSAFSGCTSLVSVDDEVFAGCSSCQSFNSLFFNCTSLTSVSENIFEGCTSAISFEGAFASCISLKTVPKKLFQPCSAASSFDVAFRFCQALETIPAGLFSGNPACTSFWATFAQTSIKSIPEELFNNCKEVESFNSTFYRCDSLEGIPANLFSNNAKAKNFESVFAECSKISNIPEALFASNTQAIYFCSAFSCCYGIKSVPVGLFANNKEMSDVSSLFSQCSSLETVPHGIFDNNRKIDGCSWAFQYCTALTGESPYTVIEGKKVHLYERGDYPDFFHSIQSYHQSFNSCTGLSDYSQIPDSWK